MWILNILNVLGFILEVAGLTRLMQEFGVKAWGLGVLVMIGYGFATARRWRED